MVSYLLFCDDENPSSMAMRNRELLEKWWIEVFEKSRIRSNCLVIHNT